MPLIERGAYQEARALCAEALRRNPNAAQAYFLLGVIAVKHRDFPNALVMFDAAIARQPRRAAYHAQRAKALLALGKRGAARATATRAAELRPNDPETFNTIGLVHFRLGEHVCARALFEQAVALAPSNATYLHRLGVSQQICGAIDDAVESFQRSLAIEPDRHGTTYQLVQLTRQTREQNYLATLKAAFNEIEDANARLTIGHAIAKTYEDLGEEPEALVWLLQAKSSKEAEARGAADRQRSLFDAAASTADPALGGAGHASSEPIFIVGMPRTGTTLVDRIFSSHPDVTSAGELENFEALLKGALGYRDRLIDANAMHAAAQLDAQSLGQRYIESTRPRTGATARFTDKLPRNFLYAALILRALPLARIICLRRDPMDTCLSNFRQLFNPADPHVLHTYDMRETALYYQLFDALVAHWRRALPNDRFMEVQYERLVSDFEPEVRRLVTFCGLPWDPRCLSFQENSAPVATPSLLQVRQPLHSNSIGRWRRYGVGLDPMRSVLSDAGLPVADPETTH
ncbi:MAG: tetratricopeptide repeat-containing sulfotransferase family protein [Caulobacteraceae bacterium]